MKLFALLISSIFVNNIVFMRFLGCCPFLGVSSRVETAKGMGLAVVFVITMSSVMTWLAFEWLLVPLHLEYLYTLAFILIIAALVQFVEIVMKKMMPALYKSLGIFQPLITTNCAVLGVAILVIQKNMNFLESVVYSASIAVGFAIALILFAGIREQLDLTGVPKGMKGVPIALVTAGILAMAFMGFNGLVPLP